MANLPILLTQMPLSSLTSAAPVITPRTGLFSGQNVDGPLWLAQTGADQYFVSADGRAFHQLRPERRVDAGANPLTAKPALLTQTPGLGSVAILHSPHGPRVLYNRADADRLMRVAMETERAPERLLRQAAFYAFSRGETPPLDGALKRWWLGYALASADPTQARRIEPVPYADVTRTARRIAHAVNNANCVLASNGPMIERTLGALSVFLEAVSESPEACRAVAEALRLHPDAERVADLLEDLRAETPGTDADADPVTVLKNSVADARDMTEGITTVVPRVTHFLKGLNERLDEDVPAGVAGVETVIREMEDEFHAAGRLNRPAAPTPIPAPGPPTIDVPVLYVEDDADAGEVTLDILQREGFSRVTLKRSVPEAMATFEANRDITVVLSDFDVGSESGLEMVREMRRRRPDLRVLFVSGNEDGLRLMMTEEERAQYGVVSKPYDIDDLNERLREVAEAASAGH